VSAVFLDADRAPPPSSRQRRLFSLTMIAGTLIPILAFMLFFSLSDAKYTIVEMQLTVLIFLFGQGHVGETVMLYFDKQFRGIIQNHKFRFIHIPIFLIVVFPIVLSLNEALFSIAVFIIIPWNLWHFSKQNIGVYAFVCLAEGRPTPNKIEKYLVNASCVLAIAAHYPLGFPNPVGSVWLHEWFVRIADFTVYPYLGVIALAVVMTIADRARHNVFTASFLFLALTFFSMVFLARAMGPGNVLAVNIGYVTAHAIQYTIIMYFLASAAGSAGELFVKRNDDAGAAEKRFSLWRCVPGIALAAGIGLWGMYRLHGDVEIAAVGGFSAENIFTNWLVASATTVVYVHFIIDAGAFRLSEKRQRDWVKGRMGFLFQR
jgi:hypothetical protein